MSSILKVDTIQDQSGNNIINESGNVITIGASGDTITVPAGATVSGFTSAGIDDNATSTAITINSSEQVGIGVDPSRPLHVIGADGNLVLFSNNVDADLNFTTASGVMLLTPSTSKLAFGVSSTEKMRLTTTGLGIGTTSTSRKLQVVQDSTSAGGIYLYSNAVHTGADTNALFSVRSDSNDGGNNGDVVNIQGDGVGDLLVLNNNGTDRVTVQADGKVGIGTASPGYPLQINSSAQSTLLHLNSTAGTSSAITFANTGSNDSIAISAESDDLKLRTDDGNILFAVAENSEKMRITSAGNVGIGNTAPVVKLHVGDTTTGSAGSTGKTIISSQDFSTTYSGSSAATWSGLQLVNHDDTSNRTATGVTFVHRSSGSGIAGIVSTSTSADRADIRFITRGSNNTIAERMRIDDDGHVICPEGVTLGTAVGTHVAANTLDDYEEGTWTPSASVGSVSHVAGGYIKIGRLVTLTIDLLNFSESSSTANIQINGIPFAVDSSENMATGAMFGERIDTNNNGNSVQAVLTTSSSGIFFFNGVGSTNFAQLRYADINDGADCAIRGTITYLAAS